MNKKLLELLNSINAKKTEVKSLVEAGKLEEAKTAKEELKTMQDSFDILKDMDDEEPVTNSVKKTEVKSLVEAGKLEEAKTAKEELKTMQDSFDILKDMDDEEPVTNSVTPVHTVTEKSFAQNVRELPLNLLKEGTDANGGYIVPKDVQTEINHYKESHKSVRDVERCTDRNQSL